MTLCVLIGLIDCWQLYLGLHELGSSFCLCRDVGSAVVQDVAATAPEDVHATRPRSRSSSASSGTRSHSPVRKHSEEHADQRSRSRSRSSGSGSRSRSSSSQSSRSRTRSRSNKRRSRSPSEEVKRVSGGDVVESEATKLEPQMPTKPVAQESDEPQHSYSDENDKHHQPMDTMKKVCKWFILCFWILFFAVEFLCKYCCTLLLHLEWSFLGATGCNVLQGLFVFWCGF